ncbi:MAG: TonB family protein [Bacteroidales bacterium]|nr:TonB family protein [Bacteroidales bacterium]
MEKKKSVKANLEKTKTLFLSIGLIIAIAIVVSAFKWQSDALVESYTNNEGEIPEEIHATVTTSEIEKPKPKTETKQQIIKSFITDLINVIPDTTNIEGPDIDWGNPPIDDYPDEIDNTPLVFASTMPEPPGGIPALQRFIARNINYPAVARENGIEGTVYLRFEVTKKGTVGKIEIMNKGVVDEMLEDASTDVIKKLPKFKPGMHNGAKVNVWFSIPISFKLKTN